MLIDYPLSIQTLFEVFEFHGMFVFQLGQTVMAV